MQSTHTFRILAGGFALAMVLTGAAQAQDGGPACSNALLQGWYGFGASGLELAAPGGAPAAAIGLFHADGQGNITTFRVREAANTSPEFMGFIVLARDVLAEGAVTAIGYTVGPDCQGSISWLDQTPFEANVPTTLPFVLVGGADLSLRPNAVASNVFGCQPSQFFGAALRDAHPLRRFFYCRRPMGKLD